MASVRSKSTWSWWHVTRRSWVQPKFTECILTHFACIRPAIAIRWCDIALRYFPVLDLSFLRSRTWGNIPDVLSYIPCAEFDISGILSNQSSIFTDFSVFLSDLTSIQSSVSVFQPHVSKVLSYESIFQPSISSILPNFTGANVSFIPEVFPNFTNLAFVTQVLAYIAYLLTCLAGVLTRLPGLQPYVTPLVYRESFPHASKRQNELPLLALMGRLKSCV
jgi:hypothetical protein